MVWFKVDDGFAFHRKTVAAGNAAIGLWARAGAWSSAQLTDGYVPAAMIAVLGGKKADATKLVTAGLWAVDGDGYRFHDWPDHNPTREDVEQGRADKAAASTVGNHIRWHVKRNVTDITCPHCTPEAGTG